MSGYGLVGFGSGLAEGLANVYGRKRQDDLATAREREGRQQAIASSLVGHLLERNDIVDYSEIQPYIDMALGTTGKKFKAGEHNPHEILSQLLQPVLSSRGAAAPSAMGQGEPPVTDPQSSPAGATADQVASVGAPAQVGAPAATSTGTITDRPSIGGVHLRTPDELTQLKVNEANALAEADVRRKAKTVRDFYAQFKAIDPDFTLRDALEAVFPGYTAPHLAANGGKGSDLAQALQRAATALGLDSPSDMTPEQANAAAAEFYATKRSMGVNREAISRSKYGKAFALLDEAQQRDVIQAETALLGQHSYATTAAGKEAEFNAPTTIAQSATTEVPVGTRGSELEGQAIPTATDRDQRRGTETMISQIGKIKKLLGVLPKKGDLGEYLPGAAIAIAKRTPEHRAEFAKLEAAVDTLVGAAARNLQQQRGAQTEKDAERAYNAAVALKTSMWDPLNGDTQESALERLNQTEELARTVLGKLPQTPVPTKAGTPRKTQPGAAPYTLTYTAKDGTQKTATFPTQAALDAAKRALGQQ